MKFLHMHKCLWFLLTKGLGNRVHGRFTVFISCKSVSLLRDEFVCWVGAGTGSRIFIFRPPPFFGIGEPHVLKADVLLQVTYLCVEYITDLASVLFDLQMDSPDVPINLSFIGKFQATLIAWNCLSLL